MHPWWAGVPTRNRGSKSVKVYESKDIRNVGVVGHGDSGKTTLTAGMLFTAGAVSRLLRVDEGNTITDFDLLQSRSTVDPRRVSVNPL